MTKTLDKADVNIQSAQQLVERIGNRFEKIWTALDGNVEAQNALTEAFDDVKQLQHIGSELDALLAGSQAAVMEMARQRDIAVHDATVWKRHGTKLASQILAGHIAVDGDIPIKDVVRVLEVLSGEKTTFEEPRLEELYEVIRDLGNALFEEQVYEAANEE